jgi:hypothetical protein
MDMVAEMRLKKKKIFDEGITRTEVNERRKRWVVI